MKFASGVMGSTVLALAGGVMVAGSTTWTRAAPTSAPTSAPAVGATDARIGEMLTQGTEALSAGDFAAARDQFLDVVQVSPRSAAGWHGLAVAYLKLGDSKKASATIERAIAIPGVIDHAMAVNAAAVFVEAKAPMRAVKVVRDYLNAKPNPMDEPLVDALAIALNQADDNSRQQNYWGVSVNFFDQYIKRMEQANPGFRRFGLEWRTIEDMATVDKANAEIQPAVEDAARRVEDAKQRLGAANRELDRRSREVKNGRMPEWFVTEQLVAVQGSKDSLERRQRWLSDVSKRLTVPAALPASITLVAMDAPVPPFRKAPAPAVPPEQAAMGQHSVPTSQPRRPRPPIGAPNQPTTKPSVAINPPHKMPSDPITGTPITGGPDQPTEQPKPVKKTRLTTSAAAFPVAPDLLVTSAEAVKNATSITVQHGNNPPVPGTVLRVDADANLALIRLKGVKMGFLDLADPAAGKLTCPAYPDVDLFAPTPVSLAATCAAVSNQWSIKFARHPRLAGAPLIQDGKVVGVITGNRDADPAAFPAVDAAAVRKLLADDAPKAASANPDPMTALMYLSATKERQ